MPDLMREPREVMRDEMVMRDRVLEALRDGPLTIPEIAQIPLKRMRPMLPKYPDCLPHLCEVRCQYLLLLQAL